MDFIKMTPLDLLLISFVFSWVVYFGTIEVYKVLREEWELVKPRRVFIKVRDC